MSNLINTGRHLYVLCHQFSWRLEAINNNYGLIFKYQDFFHYVCTFIKYFDGRPTSIFTWNDEETFYWLVYGTVEYIQYVRKIYTFYLKRPIKIWFPDISIYQRIPWFFLLKLQVKVNFCPNLHIPYSSILTLFGLICDSSIDDWPHFHWYYRFLHFSFAAIIFKRNKETLWFCSIPRLSQNFPPCSFLTEWTICTPTTVTVKSRQTHR